MIIVKKSGYLKYKKFKFRCALGKAGIKNKIKDIYDMYGLHQMTHSRAENVIFDNVNITNSILSGFKNYIDSLTVMSLVKQESQEYLVLKNFLTNHNLVEL